MSTDLDTRLHDALADAAAHTPVSDDALNTIIHRAGTQPDRHRTPVWIAVAGVATVAIVVGAVALTTGPKRAGEPTVAVVRPPSIGGVVDNCATVSSRPATDEEVALVARRVDPLPDGYHPMGEPITEIQIRAASTIDCWSAEATYLDPTDGRLLTVSVGKHGDEHSPRECDLPDGYLPVACTTVAGRFAMITDEGTRSTVSWLTNDNETVFVSGYGFRQDELIASAETVVFDGTRVSIDAPSGMQQVESSPRTRSDERDIVYYYASYSNGDATVVGVSITTWNDMTINDVGPASTIDLDGTTAIIVTTGGPGTGIIGWTPHADAVDPLLDLTTFDWPASAYITWVRDGLEFRITGPDADTVRLFAQHLTPA